MYMSVDGIYTVIVQNHFFRNKGDVGSHGTLPYKRLVASAKRAQNGAEKQVLRSSFGGQFL